MSEDSESSGRRSPLHDLHVAAGASFTNFAGWQLPVRYGSELAEHSAVRTAAGLFDLSHMAEILVLGPEAGQALDYALSTRPSGLAEHQAKYSLLLAASGGILDDLVVYRTGPDRFLVVANAANRELVAEELRQRCSRFDALVEDESEDIGLIAVQGPRAAEILQNVDGVADPEGRTDGFADRLGQLAYYRCLPGTFRDSSVLFARTGYTGEDGFELYAAPDRLPALWAAILETGAGTGLRPAGLASRDTLRLEAGMALHGAELTRSIRPAEAGLRRAVDFGKPDDFVGRLALESDGPEPGGRVLVGLQGSGRRAGRAGYPVHADPGLESAPIGEITSGALSPTLGVPIALAYLPPSYSAPGTEVFLDVRGTAQGATVVPLPFYSRKRSA